MVRSPRPRNSKSRPCRTGPPRVPRVYDGRAPPQPARALTCRRRHGSTCLGAGALLAEKEEKQLSPAESERAGRPDGRTESAPPPPLDQAMGGAGPTTSSPHPHGKMKASAPFCTSH
ncbi:hypothetical protein ZWY2020_017174 [Hordeum vulgare]|nr:hypothetical protein ZWY2020_017174 [Hordeum vulgare]